MNPTELSKGDLDLLQREEYRDLIQSKVTREAKDFLNSVDPVYCKKYEVIEKVLKILTDNDIKADIQAMLPNTQLPQRESLWSFSSDGHFIKWNERGEMTTECKISQSYLWHQRVLFFLNHIGNNLCARTNDLNHIFLTMAKLAYDGQQWSSGTPPEHIQKMIDEK